VGDILKDGSSEFKTNRELNEITYSATISYGGEVSMLATPSRLWGVDYVKPMRT
jgi:hypothetical protein